LAASTSETSSILAKGLRFTVGWWHALTALAETAASGRIAESGRNRATNRADNGRSGGSQLFPVGAGVAVTIKATTVDGAHLEVISVADTKTVDRKISRESGGNVDYLVLDVLLAFLTVCAERTVELSIVASISDKDDNLHRTNAAIGEVISSARESLRS